MDSKDGKEIVMPCKEPGCTESVRYWRIIIFGYTHPSAPAASPVKKRVYLECPNGHEHPYNIIT